MPSRTLPEPLAERIAMTGEYAEADLPALLAKVKPHVVWFPAQWPETYSYTLSAAIDAGLPIVATPDRRVSGTAGGTAADLAGRSGSLDRRMAGRLRRGAQ